MSEEDENGLCMDMVAEILSWLPAKKMVQCKLLSKSFASIIGDSTSFMSSSHPQHGYTKDKGQLWLLDIYDSVDRHPFHLGVPCITKQECLLPGDAMTSICDVLGPCNGIYLINCWYGNYLLWNPITQIRKALPKRWLSYEHKTVHGFGMDPSTKKLKVVVFFIANDRQRMQLHVWTNGSSSWTTVDTDLRYSSIKTTTSFTFVNGSYYWLARGEVDKYNHVIGFDMAADQLRLVSEFSSRRRYYNSACLTTFENSLAYAEYHLRLHTFDLYVLRGSSWEFKWRTGPFYGDYKLLGCWDDQYLLANSSSGVFAACPNRRLKLIGDYKRCVMWKSCSRILTYKGTFSSL